VTAEGENAAATDEAQRAALAGAAASGIHAIPVPTPFLVGRVNCYLIEDDPLTLVDTGPNSGKSLDALAGGLSELGHSIEELGLIVLTHQHMDHLGLVEILQRRSGAEVAALDLLAPYLEHFSASARADDEFASRVMLRHGVPPEVVTVLGSVGAAFRSFGSPANVNHPLRDGDELSLRDRTLAVAHRPGHSPSDVVLHDRRRELLIGGDHLLSRISSNPLLSRPLDRAPEEAGVGGTDRPHALLSYITSMQATREMPIAVTLGGHGPPVLDHRALIDERLRMHRRRAGRVLAMLESSPGRQATAYELASQMWGNVAVTQAYLTISEIIGHLDLLVSDGRATEDASGRVTRFAAA
jgi:glyoxylase-like metal-dependent hydrolase (beta-lactamase superfamily II)